tara:strand:- start:450 stop:905 length:456 start_codon:yes stop_codon:yes gene_type:complete
MGVYILRGPLYTDLRQSFIYFVAKSNMPKGITKGGNMPSTTLTQKSTAMDYLSAPRDSGIVKNLMALIGYVAPKNGRLPAGCKLDTLIALSDVLASDEETSSKVATRVHELQSERRKAVARVKATPESIIEAVKSGQISLSELKAKIDALS